MTKNKKSFKNIASDILSSSRKPSSMEDFLNDAPEQEPKNDANISTIYSNDWQIN